MAKDPLRTKLCDMMGIEFPIIAFTHCKDVVAAVVNAGGFAVLGEAMHTPDHIADDIKWIRSRVGDKPFGIDLVLPASAPPTDKEYNVVRASVGLLEASSSVAVVWPRSIFLPLAESPPAH